MKWPLLFLFFFVISCTQSSFVLVDDTNIPVEIADSPEERMQGLMFRESLEGTNWNIERFESIHVPVEKGYSWSVLLKKGLKTASK